MSFCEKSSPTGKKTKLLLCQEVFNIILLSNRHSHFWDLTSYSVYRQIPVMCHFPLVGKWRFWSRIWLVVIVSQPNEVLYQQIISSEVLGCETMWRLLRSAGRSENRCVDDVFIVRSQSLIQLYIVCLCTLPSLWKFTVRNFPAVQTSRFEGLFWHCVICRLLFGCVFVVHN